MIQVLAQPCRPFVVFLLSVLAAGPLVAQQTGPFTHDARSVRSRDVDQQHLRLELAFNWERQQLRGRAVHRLSPYKPIKNLQLDAAEMKIDRVSLPGADGDGKERLLQHELRANKLTVTLDHQYDVGEVINLQIDYTVVKPRHGAHFVVPDDSEPGQLKMVWTQSEPEYARYWFPCIDSPSDRLTSEVLARVPGEFMVLSNGTLRGKQEHADGTRTWHWVQQKSHVSYLISVVAGDFEALKQQWDGIPVLSYVPRGRLDLAARSFEKTPAMMQFFSEKIGYRYPWSKYAQICVDEYNWGGMEHTSATTLNLRTLHDERAHLDASSDNLVAHELAHQWFGDLLTCKDWGELWLNESFATYFATLWAEHDRGWDEATWKRYEEAQAYLTEDEKRYRRAIVNYRYNTPGNMFDRHSYPKGGRVLHMLRFVLGDDLFWKAIHRYTTINRHRTVETADLRIAIEEATGQGLNWFFDQWIYHGGHPEFDVRWQWDDDARMVRLVVKQTQKVDDRTPVFRMPVEIELATQSAMHIRRVTVSKAEETFHFDLPERPTRVCFDPRDWVLKKLTFEKSKAELLDQLEYDQHIICRVRAAAGLVRYKQDEDVLAALGQAAASDEFWGVRQEAVKSLVKFSGDKARRALLRVARKDPKSHVRREAIKSLAAFAHDETRSALREIIGADQSYHAVAESLRALLKVDRKNCVADLLAALDRDSHQEVILKAACDGLVNLKEVPAVERIRAKLKQPVSPERRVVLLGAAARLKSDDEEVVKALRKQLENERRHVRRAAIDALVAGGDPQVIDVLLEYRGKEENVGMLQAFDEALEKLRAKQRSVEQLRKETEALRRQNRQLEERLKKLEKALQK